ncbi:uncharacterized protein LOC129659367 isoform X17 [Bubalus kerabau]|uniref:uncharacterized protein LOC129659367 isoform X17 n=1 Tax=Bubalus carabanensis TaxID=3119969 RepID=UPI00244ED294|nr:uncharacterized protein LOC129659367 isoform X17 [Bubalus carabanensis]
MHSLPLCCPGKTVYSYLISQWDILLEDRGQHLEAVRRRITHAGGIQQPCADDADAACGEEPEDSSQQLAQGLTEKITICKPGRGLSSELDHTGTLTTVFPVSRTVGNKLL